MQQGYELPDEERRDELDNLLTRLNRARGALNEVNTEDHPDFEGGFSEMENRLRGMIDEAEDRLSDIPEWDRSLVQDIVLDNAGRNDTRTERVDNEVVLRFDVGDYGEETECRYAIGVTSGNEWFHVRRDGDWEEVWSN